MPENEEPKPPQQKPPPPLDFSLDLVGSDATSGISADQKSKSERSLFGEPKRREQFRQVAHYARVVILCVASIVGISVFVIRVVHFVLPENNAANVGYVHGWLTDGQLGSIDKFVFGALGTFVAQHVRKALMSETRKGDDG